MSSRNAVLWKEGLFVKPQHFQQMAFAAESALQQRISSLNDAFYGFSELELNAEYLSFGKIAIIRARGVMPDGTVFDIPGDLPAPAPLEIPSGAANKEVYLSLPLHAPGATEVRWPDSEGLDGRFIAKGVPVMDNHGGSGDSMILDVAIPNLQLKLQDDDNSNYSCLALAKVLDKRPDGSVMLDQHFYPTSLSLKGAPALLRFLEEATGLIRERARNLSERICSPGQSGIADVTDFALLQVLNRLHPYFHHLARRRHVHPEQLHIALGQACSELVTFTDDGRLPIDYPAYQHDNLADSFHVLEETLRRSLSTILQPRAVSLPIQEQRYGELTATLHERKLLEEATFILAVRADLPGDDLRKRFQQQGKVTPLEQLHNFVQLQMPGLPLIPQLVTPRYLPHHSGFVYFELDRQHESWQQYKHASGFGFHVAGEFPNLEMQFWAIRPD
ncbi:type VI secretion system baseplate subunit TssK [Pseudomonas monteilii]|uniref:type VI secretion system baseplate subunit TssK n=1 Tax=Pseudomonas monteilii TaxID=76759 RepID=UPI0015FA91A4|nr:type VI secretion system baseplate subunit TssK [Pseudomonas monteilii]MBA6105944.1 type VI secretion system baseplate subunit TssK [Pseudomonas monteilii]